MIKVNNWFAFPEPYTLRPVSGNTGAAVSFSQRTMKMYHSDLRIVVKEEGIL